MRKGSTPTLPPSGSTLDNQSPCEGVAGKPVENVTCIESCSVNKGPKASAKRIDSGHPTQSMQAELGQNLMLLDQFLHFKSPAYLLIQLVLYIHDYLRA